MSESSFADRAAESLLRDHNLRTIILPNGELVLPLADTGTDGHWLFFMRSDLRNREAFWYVVICPLPRRKREKATAVINETNGRFRFAKMHVDDDLDVIGRCDIELSFVPDDEVGDACALGFLRLADCVHRQFTQLHRGARTNHGPQPRVLREAQEVLENLKGND